MTHSVSYATVRVSSTIRGAFVALAGILVLGICASPAMAGTQYGVRCEDDFQNNWAPSVDVSPACSAFISQIGSGSVDFYYNLHGAEPAFVYGNSEETSTSWGGVDSVDFFFMSTHGTIANNNVDYAGYAMWDQNSIAWTPTMRFGDSGRQVKVFATFSCDTFKNDDGHFWNRWQSAYDGGLKIGLGAHDLFYVSNMDYVGQNFASMMQENYSIGNAWLNTAYNADNDNTPTIANTGTNSSNCWSRQGTTLGNVSSLPTLRDSQIGYYCWTNWN